MHGTKRYEVSEKTVLVQRAIIGAKHPQINPNAVSILINQTATNFLNLQMPIAAACALLSININDAGTPTRIVQLLNCISEHELVDDDNYQDILEQMTEELKKYGTVLSVTIPRPPPKPQETEENPASSQVVIHWGVGRIYAEYKRKEDAIKAQQQIASKKFSGRTVITGFFPEDKYARQDWRPEEKEEKEIEDKFRRQQEERNAMEMQSYDDNSQYYQE